ncbi:glycoside hydrolase domain-containing protein [Nocardia wallacei]|uniref:glycoside hydrolase domain-containing protein n=1 Tax=Nocardia wallacei TaxID=480035 RepID=UPI0024571C5C|nr:glycoside hydrolase domain-containing protein [Nocardia wallacei]
MRLIDHAAARVGADACRDAGYQGAIRYLVNSPDRGLPNKILTPEEAARYLELGMPLCSNWQRGKGPTADWRRGYDGGVEDARDAQAEHKRCGGPDTAPIFFSIDEDVSVSQWNALCAPYLRGVASVIGKQRTGMYGGSKQCAWAIEDDLVGFSATPGKRYLWQTRSWSNGEREAAAVLYQARIDQDQINGIGIDVSEVLADDFGQWQFNRAPAQGVSPVADKPEFEEFWAFGESNSSRWGARVRNTLWHTQESDNSDPWVLANYLLNTANQVSYHDVIGNGVVVHVVPLDRASWSVLDANGYTINLCFAGSRAAWSREQWLAREHDIKIACFLSVQYARQSGHAVDVIAPPYEVRDGISDHKYVTEALGIGNHTDLGWNFPWDVAAHWVSVYATGGTAAPVVPLIDQEAERAKGWIGDRITVGENDCPDGEGKFAEFANGYIYFSPRTGAHAIPTTLFEAYAERGWEAGPLGYPIGDHTVLSDSDGNVWGDVQGFENGALYRKYGQPGVWVHGAIRDRWNRSGYEGGPFGWPVADEEPFDGGAVQRFERGRIFWPGSRPTLALLDAGDPDVPVADAA